MCVRECVCVCVCVREYVCVHVCEHVRVHVCEHVCVHVCECVCILMARTDIVEEIADLADFEEAYFPETKFPNSRDWVQWFQESGHWRITIIQEWNKE